MQAMVVCALSVLAIVAYIALTNTNALRIGGFLTLPPRQASIFYWTIATLCGLSTIMSIRLALQSSKQSGFVEFREQTVSLPRASLSQQMIDVPYGHIGSLRIVENPGSERMLMVTTSLGNCSLLSLGFASQSEFDRFCKTLLERIDR
ncbi:MAG: hypothetical protein V4582_02720 [Pseudomonadota bacterium]